jgi:hypothetical protein
MNSWTSEYRVLLAFRRYGCYTALAGEPMDWKSAKEFQLSYWKDAKTWDRVIIEFGWPFLAAIVWAGINWTSSTGILAHLKDYGSAFFFLSWTWGQLLRIKYQDKQISATAGARADAKDVKEIMLNMQRVLVDVTKTPENEKVVTALSDMLATANNKIDSVSTNLEEAEQYAYYNSGSFVVRVPVRPQANS